jgi:ApbE superfamily uncharacterized protein (UPF0280 family)
VQAAHRAAWLRFAALLPELVAELPRLRQPVREEIESCPVRGAVAQRMWQACHPHRQVYITPMAAVAGAVAQEIVASYAREGIARAWVNNGGDIALHLAPGHAVRVGVFADLARFDPAELKALPLDGRFEVASTTPVRGIATSGWRGRSFSLGIADSVTVLARTAAEADAAATVIANAVNASDPRITRRPACEVKDESDLGDLQVTVDVPLLEPRLVQQALHSGLACAQNLCAAGLIWSAVLVCQNQTIATDTAHAGTALA